MSLSTHVLDAATGRPAAAVPVRLEAADGHGGWVVVAERQTDANGRVGELAAQLAAGLHRLRFDIEAYHGPDAFYPEVSITFRITEPEQHYHVPVLLSPFAYSTYRGS
jgi:5-hydroxyisourate hydrolase